MIEKDKEPIKDLPSATDDCADITSKYEKYKKEHQKSNFPPIEYEKPPHH